MSLSKANIGLMEGEEVIFEKQTKIGEEKKRFSLHRTGDGYITLTNRRGVISSTNKMCNCIESEKQVRIILPSTISTIGYEKKKISMCKRGIFFYLVENGNKYSFELEGADDEFAIKLVNSVYAALFER